MNPNKIIWRNIDSFLIFSAVLLDIIVTMYLLRFSLDFSVIPIVLEPENLNTIFIQSDFTGVIKEKLVVEINYQLFLGLFLLKSLIWHMLLIQIVRRIDGQNPRRQ